MGPSPGLGLLHQRKTLASSWVHQRCRLNRRSAQSRRAHCQSWRASLPSPLRLPVLQLPARQMPHHVSGHMRAAHHCSTELLHGPLCMPRPICSGSRLLGDFCPDSDHASVSQKLKTVLSFLKQTAGMAGPHGKSGKKHCMLQPAVERPPGRVHPRRSRHRRALHGPPARQPPPPGQPSAWTARSCPAQSPPGSAIPASAAP